MSKVSSAYPSYSNGKVNIGGSTATTSLGDGGLNASYNMSKSESEIYNYALDTLAQILPSINTFDANTQKDIQSSVNAYRNSGISDINSYYNNSLANLKNDIVSRFGNLDNSMFTQKFDNIEQNRAKAVSNFAQDVLARQSELESNELTKRYALINLLSGMSDNVYNKALNAINMALGSSSSANTYNSNLYKAYSNMASTQQASPYVSTVLGLLNSGLL